MARQPAPIPNLPSQRAARSRPYVTSIAALMLFSLVAATLVRDPASDFDTSIFREVYSGDWLQPDGETSADGAWQWVLPAFNRAADDRLIALGSVLALCVLVARADRPRVIFFVLAMGPIIPASLALANIFGRPGPYPVEGVGSFPSGHAMFAMAAAATGYNLTPRNTAAGRALALAAGAILTSAIGVAVIADGGHWPSDVVGGWLLSFAWVAALDARMRRGAGALSEAFARP